jgi:hypothetical protein
MRAPHADAARNDGSSSETNSDTDASIKVGTFTQVRCRRVRPIISCRFATDTMSAAESRVAVATESPTRKR